MSLKRGIDKTVQGLIDELEKKARPVKGGDDVKGNGFLLFALLFLFLVEGPS